MLKFELIDTRLEQLSKTQIQNIASICVFEGFGTDAESALDVLLHQLEESGYDVGGLESRIKARWNPTMEEGNGEDINYHLYLGIKL